LFILLETDIKERNDRGTDKTGKYNRRRNDKEEWDCPPQGVLPQKMAEFVKPRHNLKTFIPAGMFQLYG
jgi:hypothetical protein